MNALQALLGGVIDYAGMYPPARLPLGMSLRNYRAYQSSPESWLLGAFVVPVGELAPLAELLAEERDQTGRATPLPLAVIGRGGTEVAQWRENLPVDFETVFGFLQTHGDQAEVRSFEVRLPIVSGWEIPPHDTSLRKLISTGLPAPSELSGLLALADKVVGTYRDALPRMFFEPPRAGVSLPAWHGALAETAAYISSHKPERNGLKLRAGGMAAESVPSIRDIALFMQVCHTFEVRWKATAGLHLPLRHRDETLGVDVHGFLNLLVANVFLAASRFDRSPVLMLSDTCAEHFRLDEQGCAWGLTSQQQEADLSAIRFARSHGLCSFGSCSFDEPRSGLQEMGLL